ncbi:MAG: GIY-YIG nuclease family protein [Patescibacteria group bacterium]
MIYTTYVIKNKSSNKTYIGYTNNINNRIKRHNGELPNKKSSFTSRNKGLWILVYKEEFSEREDAIQREKQLKTSRGREFIKNIINTGR